MLRESIIIAIVILFVGIIVVLIAAPQELTRLPDLLLGTESFESFTEPEESDSNDGFDNEAKTTSSGGFGGGESTGGGGGGGSSSSSSGCFLNPSSFSLGNKDLDQVCLQTGPGGCTDGYVECSIVVANLDEFQSGSFSVLAKLYDPQLGPSMPIESREISSILSPGQSSIASHTFDVVDPEAGLSLDCFFETVSVPDEEVC